MKRIHVIAISVLLGFIAGLSVPAHAEVMAFKNKETNKIITVDDEAQTIKVDHLIYSYAGNKFKQYNEINIQNTYGTMINFYKTNQEDQIVEAVAFHITEDSSALGFSTIRGGNFNEVIYVRVK